MREVLKDSGSPSWSSYLPKCSSHCGSRLLPGLTRCQMGPTKPLSLASWARTSTKRPVQQGKSRVVSSGVSKASPEEHLWSPGPIPELDLTSQALLPAGSSFTDTKQKGNTLSCP